MPDLLQSLQNHDIGFLRIVAGLWGVDLESKDLDDATSELAASLLDPDLALELVTSLNSEARSAVEALAGDGGRMPWAAFARRFGQVREMGAAKRDREKPHLNPASTSEVLFYRALLFRAFFNTDKGPQEFAYIPDGLLEFVAPPSIKPRFTGKPANAVLPASPVDPSDNSEPPGRGATPGERKHVLSANDRILDDATTLLAALRSGHEPKPDVKLSVLLAAAGLISVPAKMSVAKSSSKPQSGPQINSEKARAFLEAPRPAALQMLIDAWRNSEAFNELRLMPGLVFEGEWENQPLVTRDFLLDLLQGIPDGAWWSLNAFIGGVKKTYADFQRPAGDYDSMVHQARGRRHVSARLRLLGPGGRRPDPLLHHRYPLLAWDAGAGRCRRGRTHNGLPSIGIFQPKDRRKRKDLGGIQWPAECAPVRTASGEIPAFPLLRVG